MPKISIIVPIYNTARYLSECLNSIISQSFTDWECMLINDGSTDNSQQIIDEFCSIDSRFVSLKKENQKSIDLARKYGIRFAKSEYIVNVDSDDVIDTNYIEGIWRRHVETDADVVLTRLIGCEFEVEGEAYRVPGLVYDMSRVFSGYDACLETIGGWNVSGGGMFYAKNLVRIDDSFAQSNADEMTTRFLVFSAKCVALADVKYYYRANSGTSATISSNTFGRALTDMKLEQFVLLNYPNRQDKIDAICRQRVFNLIYMSGDFYLNKSRYSQDVCDNINIMLKKAYDCLNRQRIRALLPLHNLILGISYKWFMFIAPLYVKYKRSHGGHYFYH